MCCRKEKNKSIDFIGEGGFGACYRAKIINTNEKRAINDRAKKMIFQNLDDIKNFRAQMLLSDCMNERKYQQEIKRRQLYEEERQKQLAEQLIKQKL